MQFKEWLAINEQPECMFRNEQMIKLPNEFREPIDVRYDILDMRFEDYWEKPEYNTQFQDDPPGQEARREYWMKLFQQSFQAKLPFGTNYLVYNAKTRVGNIGPAANSDTPEAPRDWWAWACFILGNDITYWKSKGILRPAMRQTA